MLTRTSSALDDTLVSVLFGAIGRILLKKGLSSMGPVTLSLDRLLTVLFRIATHRYVVIGLLMSISGMAFWLTTFSRGDLSFAYLFASLSYVLMLAGSRCLLDGNITSTHLAGTVVVCPGVFPISRSRVPTQVLCRRERLP